MMNNKKFLYVVVSDKMKEDIRTNIYKLEELLPAERILAEHYEVDRTTIRKALEILAADGFVEKKHGVGTIVTYLPSSTTLDFNSSTKRTIGFFTPTKEHDTYRLNQPFYADLFGSLESECRTTNNRLLYTTLSDEDDLKTFTLQNDVAGMIFVSEIPSVFLKQAKELAIPTVLIHNQTEGFINITPDHNDGSYQAISYLIENGHTNIALIAGPSHYQTAKDKLSGCLRGLYDSGLEIKPENITIGNFEYSGGYEGARKLFNLEDKSKAPTALFCFNDMMCLGAMKALHDMGYSVPEDVSVIGFDNMSQVRYTEPALTTISVDTDVMAKSAIWVLQQLHNTDINFFNKITTQVELIERSTVKNIC